MGRSSTKQETVVRALEDATGAVSAAQLHQAICDRGDDVSLATVYRQLNLLTAAGLVAAIQAPSGRLFRSSEPGQHHHHLICHDCGATADLHPPDESWISATAAEHGYTVTQHVIEIFGQCGSCSPSQQQ